MDCFSFLLWFLLALFAVHSLQLPLLLLSRKSNPRKLPPAPFKLPIFGNILALGSKPHKSLAKLAESHGPVMSLQLGQVTTVIISSAAMAKEVLQKKDSLFSNRMVIDALRALNHHESSVAWLPVSTHWRTLRKIMNSQVLSSSRLDASQHLRRKKVADLLSYLDRSAEAGVAVDIGQAAFSTALNLLSMTFFSVDLLEPGTDTARVFKELVWGIMAEAGKPNFADYFPMLKRLDPQRIRHRMGLHFGKMIDLFNSMINQRLQDQSSSSVEAGDALDAMLKISQDDGIELEQSKIANLLLDLFVAGTDTTSSTVEWAMAELLSNPDKLREAQEELERVIGRGNPIEEEHIVRLPYLQCVIKETFRLHPPLPFLIPRKTDVEVELCGFVVPAGAQVLINAWAIGRDPSSWENPSCFDPERFMGSKIDVKGRDFELIPFGAGRRICPGLPMATRMLPLMLGSLIHSFNWELENRDQKSMGIDMDDKFGITLQKAKHLCPIPKRVC